MSGLFILPWASAPGARAVEVQGLALQIASFFQGAGGVTPVSISQVLDDKNVRRRFRASNYQSTTRVKPFICTMPMRLDDGWNQIQFNLSDFTRRAYGTNYIETLRVQVPGPFRMEPRGTGVLCHWTRPPSAGFCLEIAGDLGKQTLSCQNPPQAKQDARG